MDKIKLDCKIYLAAGSTDLRKSITGLSYLVDTYYDENSRSGNCYMFCNSDRTRLKILQYGINGYWLYYKMLDDGKFCWPRQGEAGIKEISEEEMKWLTQGVHLIDKSRLEKQKHLRYY